MRARARPPPGALWHHHLASSARAAPRGGPRFKAGPFPQRASDRPHARMRSGPSSPSGNTRERAPRQRAGKKKKNAARRPEVKVNLTSWRGRGPWPRAPREMGCCAAGLERRGRATARGAGGGVGGRACRGDARDFRRGRRRRGSGERARHGAARAPLRSLNRSLAHPLVPCCRMRRRMCAQGRRGRVSRRLRAVRRSPGSPSRALLTHSSTRPASRRAYLLRVCACVRRLRRCLRR